MFIVVFVLSLISVIETKKGCTFTPGNLLITQPNEIFTHHFLAELTTDGDEVCLYDLGMVEKSGIIDVKFIGSQCYILDAFDGVFYVNKSGDITKPFSENWPTKGHSHFGMDFDKDGNLYVIDLGTNEHRDSRILKFTKDGTYKGVFLEFGNTFEPTDLLVDSDNMLWLTGGPSLGGSVVKKYSLDGKKIGDFKGTQSVRYFGGIIESPDGLFYVNAEGNDPQPDHMVVFDKDGNVKTEWNLFDKETGGGPNGMVWNDKEIYVLLSDPFMSPLNATQHVQVFDSDGKFVKQFGKHACSTFLCQTFNGFAMIPEM